MKKNSLIATLAAILTCCACLKDKAIPANVASGECATIVSYSTEIRPIIESSCKTGLGGGTGCHDAWIDNYDEIKSHMLSGKWRFEVISQKRMPLIPNEFGIDSLTADEIRTMQCWIDQGFPNN